ncbi:GNAT family N-acetyltransferase [Isoptericola sp. NPDC057559]|uniref:GNAT family N-acetyltransferase n=1 Tax=Isoptericola sp. NPDC057559 TaxID=3346168 RepID=UPI0036920533
MPPAPGPAPAVVPLTTDTQLASLWRDVLAPSFPPAELTSLEDLRAGCRAGAQTALGVERDGRVAAGIVASWSPSTRVLLVDYLAIAPGGRGGGVGGLLLDRSVAAWRAERSPALVLAEVEHPAHHPAHPQHGDPAARLRFYARHGARALALPYFQPGMGGPGSPRVPAMLLVALDVGAEAGGGADEGGDGWPDSVPGDPVHGFLAEHLVACEGALVEDAATRRLLGAAAGDRVPLVDPADPVALAAIPVATLEGAERYAPPRSAG